MIIMWDKREVNDIVVIVLQYINVSNQYIVHHKLAQCYMPIISQKIIEQNTDSIKNLLKFRLSGNINMLIAESNISNKIKIYVSICI